MKAIICVFFLLICTQVYAQTPDPVYKFDSYGRLISCPAVYEKSCPSKIEVACPVQNKETGVILAIGQSNAANTGAKLITTRFPKNVVNYFDGKCYVASSPLLGAGGIEGEFITPLADDLIDNGTYKSVVIIASAIPGSAISLWQKGGALNEMLLTTLSGLKNQFKITDIVWHQGETDFYVGNADAYIASFKSMMHTLADIGVTAPTFIAIATKCNVMDNWQRKNPTALGQLQLVDYRKVFLGADTDGLLTVGDRREDQCHLSASGQLKTAMSYALAMKYMHART